MRRMARSVAQKMGIHAGGRAFFVNALESALRAIEIGYRHGLVESTCLRIDETWSGLKFTHPKRGKVYNNRFGTLPNA